MIELSKRVVVEKLEFSKKILIWLFVWANVILTLAVFFVIKNQDSATLQILVSVIGLEVILAIIWYMKKAQAENEIKIRKGGGNYEQNSDSEEF